jgi:RHS repeat-associated protein
MGRRLLAARRPCTRLAARALAFVMAIVALVQTSPVRAAPGDIFSVAAPAVGAATPKGADIGDGDASVAMQTGAFTYGYPISVPPGRHGMQPHLSLSYSSQAPIYGTIAAGWSLSIPIITLDTSQGRLVWQLTQQLKHYQSSMAGGRPLFQNFEPSGTPAGVYLQVRAQNDATFTRYELGGDPSTGPAPFIDEVDQAYWWRAFTTDGATLYFGHLDAGHAGGCAMTDEYAPLTRVKDTFGNEVNYNYTLGPGGDCVISSITWGRNNPANLADFATVAFFYSTLPCLGVPVGSQTSYRTGTMIVTGASELDSITVTAYPPNAPGSPVHTRVYTLAYEAERADCFSATHSPYRSLQSITESAWGVDSPRVDLPPVVFTYGSASLSYPAETPFTLPWLANESIVPDSAYNLGWGLRPAPPADQPAQWPTVEAMMLDIDGDGRLDRVVNDPQTESGVDSGGGVNNPQPAQPRVHCGLAWQRNVSANGVLAFDPPAHITLPTLKWATPADASDPYSGGINPNDINPQTCALNYQLTLYRNSAQEGSCADPDPNVFTLSGCPTTTGTCTNGSDCNKSSSVFNFSNPTYFAYRWFDINGDGLVDLVASPVGSAYNLIRGTGIYPTGMAPYAEPALFGSTTFPTCPDTPISADGFDNSYTMCGGMSPWFVYLNHGIRSRFGGFELNPLPWFGEPAAWGASPTPDYILYQPIALETNNGDGSILSAPIGMNQGAVDVDGDGLPDGVFTQSTHWDVYRNMSGGNGGGLTGQLMSASGSAPFIFGTNPNEPIQFWSYTAVNSSPFFVTTQEAMLDVNGDHMSDYWYVDGSVAQVEFSDGVTRTQFGRSVWVHLGTDVAAQAETHTSLGWIAQGRRYDQGRTYDVDLDGRIDVVRSAPGNSLPPTAPFTYFNLGGAFGSAQPVADVAAAQHAIVAAPYPPGASGDRFMWQTRSDVIDLDGDGIPDGVNCCDQGDPTCINSGTGHFPHGCAWSHVSTPAQPPRLLATVDNGRGAVTTVTYAPITNPSVVDQRLVPLKTAREMQWVVANISTVDSLANAGLGTQTTTSYHYTNPVWTKDADVDFGATAWRGFEQVTTSLPTGAASVNRYDYSVDWSGRLVTTMSVPAPAETTVSGEVRSIEDTTWTAFRLFASTGSPIITYHATAVDHWTCKNGQDEPTCRSSVNDDTHTRTVATVTGLRDYRQFPFEPASLVKETESWLQTGASARSSPPVLADGDRITSSAYILVADGATYRLLPKTVTKSVQSGGTATMFAYVAHTFDPTYSVAITDTVATDGSTYATTKRDVDMTTGNVIARYKPMQNPDPGSNGDGAATTYTYDSRQLLVTAELSEPNARGVRMERDCNYEYGTGTKLETIGPNVAPCSSYTQGCPAGTLPKEDHRIRVDGLGRPIERHESYMNNGGASYLDVVVEMNAYVDGPAASVTHQRAIDGGNDYAGEPVRYTQDRTDLDGHGRPIRKTVFAQGAAPADAITTYQFNNDGTLASVSVPDPSKNDTSTVTYTYTFDSLGRPVAMRRPDDATPGNQSGVGLVYDGLLTTSVEMLGIVGSSLAQGAATQTAKDAFGRILTVTEQTSTSPVAWVTTTYRYDAADNVTQVTDPEGVVTTMTHDLAGRRTSITRNGRVWKYAYDRNGNVQSTQVPGATGAGDQANYITSIVYDDLDRPLSKLIGSRTLSAADVAHFGADHETFTYDNGSNDTGHLYAWGSYGSPSATSPSTFIVPTFNAQGQQQQNYEYTSGVGGSPPLHRFTNHYYRVDGSLAGAYLGDYVGPNPTTSTYFEQRADARGMPSQIYVSPYSAPSFYVVNYRNVAGLVTRQAPAGGSTSWPTIESDWTYDTLGRVASQKVLENWATTLVARQDLEYTRNYEVKQLDQYLGAGNHKTFQYGFDLRHQITSANESTTSGYFSASYQYGPGGRFTNANEQQKVSPAPTGSNISTRDVAYQYATGPNSDPEEVAALTSGNSTYASFAYDAAGNQTMRCMGGLITAGACTGATETDYVYDGKDQLRRATQTANGIVLGSEDYWYDASGKRMLALKRDGGGKATELVWWIDEVEAHYDATNNYVVSHAYSYITLGNPVARIDRVADRQTNTEYLYRGLAGSTLTAVDQATGNVNASFSYTPYGAVIEAVDGGSTEGLASTKRQWNDKFIDDISGLAYYGVRYYDRTTMTWTQSDPLFRFAPDAASNAPRRSNLYSYSLNNSLRYIDPDGRFPFLLFLKQLTKKAVETGAEVVVEVGGAFFGAIGIGAGIGLALSFPGGSGGPGIDPNGYTSGEGCGSYCDVPATTKTNPTRARQPTSGPYRKDPYEDSTPGEPKILKYPPGDPRLRDPIPEPPPPPDAGSGPDAPGPDAPGPDAPTIDAGNKFIRGFRGAFNSDEVPTNSTFRASVGGSPGAGNCDACTFSNPDLFMDRYFMYWDDVHFGVWGIEINPNGPWASTPQPGRTR